MLQHTWVTVWVSQVSEPTFQVGRGPCLTLSTLIELSERTQERTLRELWEITQERTLIEHSLHSWSAPTCLARPAIAIFLSNPFKHNQEIRTHLRLVPVFIIFIKVWTLSFWRSFPENMFFLSTVSDTSVMSWMNLTYQPHQHHHLHHHHHPHHQLCPANNYF